MSAQQRTAVDRWGRGKQQEAKTEVVAFVERRVHGAWSVPHLRWHRLLRDMLQAFATYMGCWWPHGKISQNMLMAAWDPVFIMALIANIDAENAG